MSSRKLLILFRLFRNNKKSFKTFSFCFVRVDERSQAEQLQSNMNTCQDGTWDSCLREKRKWKIIVKGSEVVTKFASQNSKVELTTRVIKEDGGSCQQTAWYFQQCLTMQSRSWKKMLNFIAFGSLRSQIVSTRKHDRASDTKPTSLLFAIQSHWCVASLCWWFVYLCLHFASFFILMYDKHTFILWHVKSRRISFYFMLFSWSEWRWKNKLNFLMRASHKRTMLM